MGSSRAEFICKPITDLLQGKATWIIRREDPYYFMSLEKRSKPGTCGWYGPGISHDEVVRKSSIVEISMIVPNGLVEKKMELVKDSKRRSSERYPLYAETRIEKAAYFDQVLSIIKKYEPEITAKDLLYVRYYIPPHGDSKEILNPLFGKEEVEKRYDPLNKLFKFDVAFQDFEKEPEKWETIIRSVLFN